MTLVYDCCNLIMRGLLLAFSRLDVTGKENVPREGPLILVSNHLNLADPPLLGAVCPRPITFMAKDELFRHPLAAPVVKLYGAFPVKRNKPDRQAIRGALAVLERQGVLGLFPEGRRNPLNGLGRAEAGVALIASLAQTAIVPVAITGTEEIEGLGVIIRRPRIRVRFGTPFTLPAADRRIGGRTLSALADEIMRSISAMLPPRYRGVYADVDDLCQNGAPSNTVGAASFQKGCPSTGPSGKDEGSTSTESTVGGEGMRGLAGDGEGS